jgi:hypothetical protein
MPCLEAYQMSRCNIKCNTVVADISQSTAAKHAPYTRQLSISVTALYLLCLVGVAQSVLRLSYRLEGLETESRWGRKFLPVQNGPGAHPASCTMGNGSFPGVKCIQGLTLTTHPLLVPRTWKSRAIPLPPSGPQPGL